MSTASLSFLYIFGPYRTGGMAYFEACTCTIIMISSIFNLMKKNLCDQTNYIQCMVTMYRITGDHS